MITIRDYRTRDERQVKEMISRVLTEIFGSFGIKEWEDFSEYAAMYVAEDNDRIIGSAALKDMGNGTGKLKRMYVYKDYQSQGIGSRLLDQIEGAAVKRKLERIILSTTHPQLEAAFEFYKKHGFTQMKEVDMERDFPDLKGETVNLAETRFMEKKLRFKGD